MTTVDRRVQPQLQPPSIPPHLGQHRSRSRPVSPAADADVADDGARVSASPASSSSATAAPSSLLLRFLSMQSFPPDAADADSDAALGQFKRCSPNE